MVYILSTKTGICAVYISGRKWSCGLQWGSWRSLLHVVTEKLPPAVCLLMWPQYSVFPPRQWKTNKKLSHRCLCQVTFCYWYQHFEWKLSCIIGSTLLEQWLILVVPYKAQETSWLGRLSKPHSVIYLLASNKLDWHNLYHFYSTLT